MSGITILEPRFGLRIGIQSRTHETAINGDITDNTTFNWDVGTTIGNWSLDQIIASSIAANSWSASPPSPAARRAGKRRSVSGR